MASSSIQLDPALAAARRPEDRDTEGAGDLYAASPAQKSSWFLSRLHSDSPAFNISRAYWVQGEVDVPRLERCLGDLLQRHKILRSSFSIVEDRLVQIVRSGIRLQVQTVEIDPRGESDPSGAALALASRSARRRIDVTACPLVRCELCRLDTFRGLLILTVHRVVADERSVDLLMDELVSLYGAALDSNDSRVRQSVPQYVEFAQRQTEELRAGLLKEQLERWIRRLPDPLPVLELPLDHPRPAVRTMDGARVEWVLPTDLASAIEGLANHHGTHVGLGVLAGFCVLLHRYTAQAEILVGIRVDGRQQPLTREMVGPLENTLVVGATLAQDPTFREVLGKLIQSFAEVQALQDVPFESLVEELKPDRNIAIPPLCQVLYRSEDKPVKRLQLAEATLVPVGLTTVPCSGDLTLDVAARGPDLLVRLDYNPGLLRPCTITRMLAQLEILLRGIVAEPGRRICDLPLLTDQERQQVLVRWNDTARDYPREKCLHHLFEEVARRSPGAVAVESDGQRLTYLELNAHADRLAARLSTAGVGPEAIVPLCVERSLEMVVGALGILKAGGAYLPLDPTYPRERLLLMLQDCQARAIVIQPRLGEIVAGQKAALIHLEPASCSAVANDLVPRAAEVTPENLAYVMYTSGSTGRPKGVLVTHRNVVHSTCARFLQYDQKVDSFLMLYSHAFDSSVAGIFWTLCQGGRLVLPSVGQERNPAELARVIAGSRVSHLDCLPSLYRLLLECARAEDLTSLRVVIVGGEACPAELVDEHYRRLPRAKLYNEYGPTECTVWSTVYPIEGMTGGATVPIGRPIANMKAYVLDAQRRPVPQGVPGELYLGGDGVARGYLNQPAQTAENFVSNPFDRERSPLLYRTGDRARHLPDGNIEYLGRTDRQVKVRGFRIEVGEIEASLATHPAVSENVVVAREDTPGVRRLVAYVRCRVDASAAELRAFLNTRLPNHMVPSAIVLLDSLPRTPNGKVDLQALPAPSLARVDVGAEFSRPANAVQARLVELWERMLGVQPVGIRSNFFELGGDSLLAVRLYLEIERAFGRTLPLATFIQAPTVEGLAEVLGQEVSLRAWSSLVAIQPHGSRPPLYLVAGTGGNVIGYEPLARHLGHDQPVYGLQSWGLSGRHPPHTRIEEMAAHYISEMRALQPQGPYFLGGLSFGGMVAYEMAQQLHAQGQAVGLVALLDTDYEGRLEQLNGWQSLVRWLYLTQQRLAAHVGQIRRLRRSDVGTYIRGKTFILKSRLKNRISENAYMLQERGGASLSTFLQNVRAANHLASRRYRPRVYAGRLTLFRAGRPSADAPKWHPWAAWHLLAAGGLTVHYVAGDHVTVLHEPHVKVLAEKLTESIDDVHSRKRG